MKANQLLKIMHVLAWVVFIGLCIKTGAYLFSYFISIKNPEVAKNVFDGLNLSQFYNFSFTQYSFIISYKVAVFAIEAYLAFLIVNLLKTINIERPFDIKMQKLMEKISYSIFNLWLLAILHNTHVRYVAKKHNFSMDLFSTDFIFLAGVIFIFAQIVKKGIEIQTENELTI